MEQVFFAHGGQIISHKIVLKTKDNFYLDRADSSTKAVMPLPLDLLGTKVHETFDSAKEARLKEIEEVQKKLNKEKKELEAQKKAVDGSEVAD